MPVHVKDVPAGYDWGWFSNEDQRMHLQLVSPKHRRLHYKVWLEERGRRCFEPAISIPAQILKALRKFAERDRDNLEWWWTQFMIRKGWLKIRIEEPLIQVIAYPNSPNAFVRSVDLRIHYPGSYAPSTQVLPEFRTRVTPRNTGLKVNPPAIAVHINEPEANHFEIVLPEILWQDV